MYISKLFLKLFLQKSDSHHKGTADHKHIEPRQVGIRKLMIEIPEISPCHLAINHSENFAQADHTPHDPLPHTVFKNPSLKAIGEFGSSEHKVHVLLAWHPAINAVFSFTTILCQ